MPKNIYVGNLNCETTADKLRTLFEGYGEVTSANVITDRYSGRSRGFGFVEMAVDDEADEAISALNGQTFEGRQIRVDEAKPRKERWVDPGRRQDHRRW